MASTLQLAKSGDRLWQIIVSLRAHEGALDAQRLVDILNRSDLCSEDVSDFIAPTRFGYGRRRIVRTDKFEVLVMTWLAGQCTGAHDHGGVHSVFRILSGRAHETRFVRRPDSLVEPVTQRELKAGEVASDAGELIHDIRNDGEDGALLVSLHVYAPPLPELRRFAVTEPAHALPAPFKRTRTTGAHAVAIVGGGYSGSMVAAQLARRRCAGARPLHVMLFDRQTSLAEGAAYRTPDPGHLLNIPAAGMSAWPDRPDHFLEWSVRRNSHVTPYSFIERRAYGEYLRTMLFETLSDSAEGLSFDSQAREVESLKRRITGGWHLAEKFHALITRGITNSRLNNFYDLWLIAETFDLQHRPLATAIRQTFARRATALPQKKPTAFTEAYAATWDGQWQAFLTRERMTAAPERLAAVQADLERFLLPLLEATDGSLSWKPRAGWVRAIG